MYDTSTQLPSWLNWRIHFWPVATAVLATILILAVVGGFWQYEMNKKQDELNSYNQYLQERVYQLQR